MTDLDEMIAEARTDLSDMERCQMLGVTPATGTLGRMLRKVTDALQATKDERDAALARIERLEREKSAAHRLAAESIQSSNEFQTRIAEAAKLHRKYTYYDLEDSCPDTTDEHREEHHHEASDDIGEFYCDQMPTGDVCCDICRDVNGDRVPWPCPTAVSLGLNEGEDE